MSDLLDLETIDTDGAVREAAEAVDADTRLGFLRKAGLGLGAAMSGGAVLSALAPAAMAAGSGRPPASFGKGDIGILNYALTLEYLEASFYAQAVRGVSFSDPHLKALAVKIASDEATHVAFLKKALGRHAVKEPKFDFGSAASNQSTFTATSQALENTGVAAYFGQGFNIISKSYLADAISILTVEARHAGAIGFYNDPTAKAVSPEGAFDKPKTASQVLSIVNKTHFIVG